MIARELYQNQGKSTVKPNVCQFQFINLSKKITTWVFFCIIDLLLGDADTEHEDKLTRETGNNEDGGELPPWGRGWCG